MTRVGGSLLVVRRSRERRMRKTTEGDKQRVIRRGFVFDEDQAQAKAKAQAKEEQIEATKLGQLTKEQQQQDPQEDTGVDFAFRFTRSRSARLASRTRARAKTPLDLAKTTKPKSKFRKTKKKVTTQIDAAGASAALFAKKQTSLRRVQKQKRQQEAQKFEELQQQLESRISGDQMRLLQLLHSQLQREKRKTEKEFACSSAKRDIQQLTEKALDAFKEEFVQFLLECPPQERVVVERANAENARLEALIQAKTEELKRLEETEGQWFELFEEMETRIATIEEQSSKDQQQGSQDEQEGETEADNVKMVEMAVEETQAEDSKSMEIDARQQETIDRIKRFSGHMLRLDAAMQSINGLLGRSVFIRTQLYDSFQRHLFKGYNTQWAKENHPLAAATQHILPTVDQVTKASTTAVQAAGAALFPGPSTVATAFATTAAASTLTVISSVGNGEASDHDE